MKNYPRQEEPAFPALPEKDGVTAKPPTPLPVPSLADLANRYEPEVFELVRDSLDDGHSQDAIVATLRSHDFASDEARTIVRAVVDDRKRNGGEQQRLRSPQRRRVGLASQGGPRQQFAGEMTRKEAAARDMGIGMLWFVGGVVLTAATHSMSSGGGGVVFYGAVLWGLYQFLRGLIHSAGSKD
jgi:hypothetical protein